MSWFDEPVSLGHGQKESFGTGVEQGIDIETRFHEPITELLGGLVDVTQWGPFGGLVGVKTSAGEEYFMHLDTIDVKRGQHVDVGDRIGLSGGQLSGGEHPNSPRNSTGPHTEYGVFSGALFGSQPLDPTGIINAAKAGTAAPAGAGGFGLPDPGALVGGALQGVGHGLADALAAGLDDVGTFLKRQIVALAVALVVAIVLFA